MAAAVSLTPERARPMDVVLLPDEAVPAASKISVSRKMPTL